MSDSEVDGFGDDYDSEAVIPSLEIVPSTARSAVSDGGGTARSSLPGDGTARSNISEDESHETHPVGSNHPIEEEEGEESLGLEEEINDGAGDSTHDSTHPPLLEYMEGKEEREKDSEEKEADEAKEKDFEKMVMEHEESKKIFAAAREEYLKSQREQDLKKAVELKERIKFMKDQAEKERVERNQLREEVISLKYVQSNRVQAEIALATSIHSVNISQQNDKLLVEKIRLEQIQEQLKLSKDRENRRRIHLLTVQEEITSREERFSHDLKQLIHKAELLEAELNSGEFDKKFFATFAEALAEGNSLDEGGSSQLIKEILARRQQNREKDLLDMQDKMTSLNMERCNLMHLLRDTVQKKKEHEALMDKGLEFLEEVEMGHAPPIEYIFRNLAQDSNFMRPTTPDLPDLRSVISLVTESLSEEEQKLEALKQRIAEERRSLQSPDFVYDGSYGIDTVEEKLRECYTEFGGWIAELVDSAVEAKATEIQFAEWEVLEGRQLDWDVNAAYLAQKEMEKYVGEKANEFWEAVSADALHSIATDVVMEVLFLRAQASKLSLGIILQGYSVVHSLPVDEKDKDKKKKKELAGPFNGELVLSSFEQLIRNRSQRHPEVFRHSMHLARAQKEDGHKDKKKKNLKKKDAEDAEDEDEDLDVRRLKLESVGKCEVQHSFAEIEKHYWKKIEIIPSTNVVVKKDISSIAASLNGLYLAIGTNRGEVLVFQIAGPGTQKEDSEVSDNEAILLREFSDPAHKDEIIALQFGWNAAQILVLDAKGVIRVLWMVGATPNMDADKSDNLTFKPSKPRLVDTFNHTIIEEIAIPTGDTLKGNWPQLAVFHPSMTLMGSHTAVMTALVQPTFAMGRVDIMVEGQRIPESIFPKLGKERVELFKGHRSRILLIEFTGDSNVISIDERGSIFLWPYSKDGLTGFGWFEPKFKLQIDLNQVDYVQARKGETIVFPPKKMKTPKNIGADIDFVQASETAEAELEKLKLEKSPFADLSTETNKIEVYKVAGMDDVDFDAHVLTYSGDGYLMQHKIANYTTVKKNGKVIAADVSRSKHDAVIASYMPPVHGQAEGLLEVVLFHVESRSLVPPRLTLHQPSLAPDDVHVRLTPVYDTTGSDHILLLIIDKIRIFSVHSGQELYRFRLVENAPVRSMIPLGDFRFAILFKNSKSLQTMILADDNSKNARRKISHRTLRPRAGTADASQWARSLAWQTPEGYSGGQAAASYFVDECLTLAWERISDKDKKKEMADRRAQLKKKRGGD